MKILDKIKIGLPLKKTVIDKINEIVSYLKASRLVQGPGIRLQETSNGVIVSTVSASRSQEEEDTPTGSSVRVEYAGAFAVALVGGTAARIYHGSRPSGEYAGSIRIGNTFHNMPVGMVAITPQAITTVYLTVYYDTTLTPPALVYGYDTALSNAVTGDQGWYHELATVSAAGELFQEHCSGNIEITGRWV